MNFFLIGGKNESSCEYPFGNPCFAAALCCCKIDACNPRNRQLGNYCRRFGGAYSLLSFLEVNYDECFTFHFWFSDGRLRRSYDYRAQHSDGVSD